MTAITQKIKAWLSDRSHIRLLVQCGLVAAVCAGTFLYALYRAQTIGKLSTGYSPDERNYIEMAKRILNGQPYGYWNYGPDAYVSPGLPMFLVGCMAIFGTDAEAIFCIKVVQCLLTALTVLLTYLLGRLLTGRFGVGLFASLMVATNGLFYVCARHLLTENLYFFTMMLFFVMFVYALKRGRWWLHLLAGVCFAVTIMVRPLVLVVAPFLYLPLAVARWKQWKQIFTPVLWFAVGFVAVCLPWWVRNYVVLGKVVLFATQTNPMYAGLAPDVKALGLKNPGSLLGNLRLLLRLMRQDFSGTLYWMTFGKFQIIFMGDMGEASIRILSSLSRNLTVCLGLCGGIRAMLSRKGWGPALAFWAYFASSFLFVPNERYSLQYIPLLAILAGYLLSKAFDGWRDSSWLPSRAKPSQP